jgi:hypothetical protein
MFLCFAHINNWLHTPKFKLIFPLFVLTNVKFYLFQRSNREEKKCPFYSESVSLPVGGIWQDQAGGFCQTLLAGKTDQALT